MIPDIDPVALTIGPVQVHWYGLMYLIGFLGGYWLGTYRARSTPGWDAEQVSDLLFYIAVGVIVGGRLGYVLFYKAPYYLANPLEVFFVWQGGMSFHGGLLGVLTALVLFARAKGKTFLQVSDFVAPLTPLGLGAGRIGNFINQELWGRATGSNWAMVFPRTDPTLTPRHPSMLYEAFLEGLLLFLILWWFFFQAATQRGRFRIVFTLLWYFPFCGGVCQGARRPSGLPGLGLGDDGSDIDYSHGLFWSVVDVAASLTVVVAWRESGLVQGPCRDCPDSVRCGRVNRGIRCCDTRPTAAISSQSDNTWWRMPCP